MDEDQFRRLVAAQAATQRRGQDDEDAQTDILENVYERAAIQPIREVSQNYLQGPTRAPQGLSSLRGRPTQMRDIQPISIFTNTNEVTHRNPVAPLFQDPPRTPLGAIRPGPIPDIEVSGLGPGSPVASSRQNPASLERDAIEMAEERSLLELYERQARSRERRERAALDQRRAPNPDELEARRAEDEELAEAVQKSLLDIRERDSRSCERRDLEEATRQSLLDAHQAQARPAIVEIEDDRRWRESMNALHESAALQPTPGPVPPTQSQVQSVQKAVPLASDCLNCIKCSQYSDNRLTIRCGFCDRRYHLACLQQDLKGDITELECMTRKCSKRFTTSEIKAVIDFRWEKYKYVGRESDFDGRNRGY